jgi:hypothetical protein
MPPCMIGRIAEGDAGTPRARWTPTEIVIGVPVSWMTRASASSSHAVGGPGRRERPRGDHRHLVDPGLEDQLVEKDRALLGSCLRRRRVRILEELDARTKREEHLASLRHAAQRRWRADCMEWPAPDSPRPALGPAALVPGHARADARFDAGGGRSQPTGSTRPDWSPHTRRSPTTARPTGRRTRGTRSLHRQERSGAGIEGVASRGDPPEGGHARRSSARPCADGSPRAPADDGSARRITRTDTTPRSRVHAR